MPMCIWENKLCKLYCPYRDLRALLKLLTHLTQRDLIDFGSDEGQDAPGQNGTAPAVDVAQLVFLGLDIIIPLVSVELLGYPKLCLLYFQLPADMLEVSVRLSCQTHTLHSNPADVQHSWCNLGATVISVCCQMQSGPCIIICVRHHISMQP